MSLAAPARLIGRFGLATLLLVAAGRSEEKKSLGAAQPAASAAHDPLAETRTALDGLAVGLDPGFSTSSGVPRLSAPEWHGGTNTSAPPASPPRQSFSPETKSRNWLLDAMQRPASETGARINAARDLHPDRELTAPTAERRERKNPGRSEPRDSAGRDAPDAFRPGGIMNPLATYLDAWMTPQDYALLKPGLTSGGPGHFAPDPAAERRGGVEPGAHAFPAPISGVPTAGSLPALHAVRPARENPFLQALNAPAAPTSSAENSSRSLAPAPVISPAAPPPAGPPAPPAVAPRVPEFARPATDDKYFKPLKRF